MPQGLQRLDRRTLPWLPTSSWLGPACRVSNLLTHAVCYGIDRRRSATSSQFAVGPKHGAFLLCCCRCTLASSLRPRPCALAPQPLPALSCARASACQQCLYPERWRFQVVIQVRNDASATGSCRFVPGLPLELVAAPGARQRACATACALAPLRALPQSRSNARRYCTVRLSSLSWAKAQSTCQGTGQKKGRERKRGVRHCKAACAIASEACATARQACAMFRREHKGDNVRMCPRQCAQHLLPLEGRARVAQRVQQPQPRHLLRQRDQLLGLAAWVSEPHIWGGLRAGRYGTNCRT